MSYTHKTIYGGLISTNLMVDNHKPAWDFLSMLSSKCQAKAVDGIDFSDMHTVLQHDLVTDAISPTVTKVVGEGSIHIATKLDFRKCVSKKFMLKALNLLPNSSYFAFRDMVVKQYIGEPHRV